MGVPPPPGLWRGRSRGVGGSPVRALYRFRERPVNVNCPAGREIRSPVIPGLVGKRSRGLPVWCNKKKIHVFVRIFCFFLYYFLIERYLITPASIVFNDDMGRYLILFGRIQNVLRVGIFIKKL